MKKAATLFLFLAFAGLRSLAQTTAVTVTLPSQLHTPGQYFTVPNTAFSGSAPAAMTVSWLQFSKFPKGAQSLSITPEGGTESLYSSPQAGMQVTTNTLGRPSATIKILPSVGADTITIYYKLVSSGAGGSNYSSEACIYIPLHTVPLNTTLTRFAGAAKSGSSQLEWMTGSEDGLRGFEVEWSSNLTDWSVVGTVASRGAGSMYEWRHTSPAQGANYYRVRSLSFSGANVFSSVVRVNHDARSAAVVASPNPVRDFLRIEGPAGSVASLIDLSGKEMARLQLAAVGTLNMQQLASGVYQLTVRDASGSVLAQERILKP